MIYLCFICCGIVPVTMISVKKFVSQLDEIAAIDEKFKVFSSRARRLFYICFLIAEFNSSAENSLSNVLRRLTLLLSARV